MSIGFSLECYASAIIKDNMKLHKKSNENTKSTVLPLIFCTVGCTVKIWVEPYFFENWISLNLSSIELFDRKYMIMQMLCNLFISFVVACPLWVPSASC